MLVAFGPDRPLVAQTGLNSDQGLVLPIKQAPQAKPACNPHQEYRPAMPNPCMDQVIGRAIERYGKYARRLTMVGAELL